MDRNQDGQDAPYLSAGSLSARRAWIEILPFRYCNTGAAVALRKESVDRNSAPKLVFTTRDVALRKESVDRNVSRA